MNLSFSGVVRAIRSAIIHINTTEINSIKDSEISHLRGVRSNIQDQITTLDQKKNDLKSLLSSATASETDVLNGKTFFAGTAKKTGTMVNQGGVTQYLDAGKRVAIPKGFHNGNGVVVARELGVQTPGTAVATDMANGKTAWVNGQKVIGSLSVIASGQYVESDLAEITKDGKKAVLFRVYIDGLFRGGTGLYVFENYIADLLGITADKIMKGNTICGIAGSAETPYCRSLSLRNTFEGMLATNFLSTYDIIGGAKWYKISSVDKELGFNIAVSNNKIYPSYSDEAVDKEGVKILVRAVCIQVTFSSPLGFGAYYLRSDGKTEVLKIGNYIKLQFICGTFLGNELSAMAISKNRFTIGGIGWEWFPHFNFGPVQDMYAPLSFGKLLYSKGTSVGQFPGIDQQKKRVTLYDFNFTLKYYMDDVVEPNVMVNLVSRSPIDDISVGVSISYL